MEPIIPIIIPAYEPDQRLLHLLEELTETISAPLIIVDDGSGADYQPIFEACENRYHATVLHHQTNSGKGRALKTAFSYCLEHINAAGCITADSDGQHSPAAIEDCQKALLQNPRSLILGVRDFSEDHVPPKSRIGNQLTRKVFRLLYGRDVSDTQTGLRGIPAYYMNELLSLSGERFEFETQMLIDAIDRQIPFIEVPVETIYDSKDHHSTHFKPFADSIKVYMTFRSAFGKFILSSLSSSILDLALFQTFCVIMRGHTSGLEYAAAASIIARIISATYNYLINYKFVFVSRKKHSRSALAYTALALVQMVSSTVLTSAAIACTHIRPEVLVKMPIDIALFFISYIIQKKYIY